METPAGSPEEILPHGSPTEGLDGGNSSSASTVEGSLPGSPLPAQQHDGSAGDVAGAAGVGPLGQAPGLGGATDELEAMMSRLRLDAVLRTRLEERLIAEGRQVADAHARGKKKFFVSVFAEKRSFVF